MARYIDADALIEQLKEADRNCPNDIIKCCIGLVQTQPTAYDVEAVVAELKESVSDVSGLGDLGLETEDAIEIVRNGGKE